MHDSHVYPTNPMIDLEKRCTKNVHITYLVHELDESKKNEKQEAAFFNTCII